jgi:hypothetical protein
MLAAQEKCGLYQIRQKMATLLLDEGKPNTAVEILISGICEAQRQEGTVPSSLERDLKKALIAAGCNIRLRKHSGIIRDVIATCKVHGERAAVELIHRYLQEAP